MNSSKQNTKPAGLTKQSTGESEDLETRANRLAAERAAGQIVEGLRKLAREKAARKNRRPAA